MATKQPAKTITRQRLKVDLPDSEDQVVETETAQEVTVNVPKAFNLTLDNGQTLRIEAGPQALPIEHATHWYAVANGVTPK